VREDREWQLAFPITLKEYDAEKPDLAGRQQVPVARVGDSRGLRVNDEGLVACKIYKTLPARRMWDLIMTSTYDFAEPGFILIDRVNEMNNNWWCENIRATNPCVTADTCLHTRYGKCELIGQPFDARVDGQDHASAAEGFFRTARKPVVRIATAEGHVLRLTSDHRRRIAKLTRWEMRESEWCASSELHPGDQVLLNDHRAGADWEGDYTHEQGYLIGLLIGDGVLSDEKAILSVWEMAAAANDRHGFPSGVQGIMDAALRAAMLLPHRADFAGWHPIAGRREYRMQLVGLRALAHQLGLSSGHKTITPEIERASSEFYRGLLRGLFDTDGSVQGTQSKGISVRLAQSELPLLEAAQRMLLRLGVASSIYAERRPAGSSLLPNGHGGRSYYPTRAQHELVISGENLDFFVSAWALKIRQTRAPRCGAREI
jgi:ribonucleoside-diphosphate reductase alpha chain